MIIHNNSLVRVKYNLQTLYVMESFGIIEMLGWYVVGFSTTILTLQIVSKLNLGHRKEKKMANTMYLLNKDNEYVNAILGFFANVGYIGQA